MKDLIGNEIKVGDFILYVGKGYLTYGWVVELGIHHFHKVTCEYPSIYNRETRQFDVSKKLRFSKTECIRPHAALVVNNPFDLILDNPTINCSIQNKEAIFIKYGISDRL